MPTDDGQERELLRRGFDRIRNEIAEHAWPAFWRTSVNGLSAAEAAAELSMTAGTARVAKSRGLQRLRAELRDLPDD